MPRCNPRNLDTDWAGGSPGLCFTPDLLAGCALVLDHQLSLLVLEGTFAVCRLAPDAAIPSWAITDCFFSVCRTAEELSIVCRADAVLDGVTCERGWRCVRVADTIAFSEIGVLASLVTPLAAAAVSVFAISTFDTDYLLLKEQDFEKAAHALRRHGHELRM